MNDNNDGLMLTGLDGSNPLGFLAALGVVAVLDAHGGGQHARMSWTCTDSWHPMLKCGAMTSQDLASLLFARLRKEITTPLEPMEGAETQHTEFQGQPPSMDPVSTIQAALGQDLSIGADQFRTKMIHFLDTASDSNRIVADLVSHFGSDVCHHPKSETIQATPF